VVAAADIGWASYRQFEGPFFRGHSSFRMPAEPTEADRIVRVITATEGGHYDSFNGYDKCDATLGLIQWCDHAQYSVCDMLGHTAGQHPEALGPINAFCDAHGLTFKKNGRGRWRYFFGDERGEVDRSGEQDQLYHLNSSGHKGTWDDESRAYAKQFAAAMASVYNHVGAQEAQVDFTVKRLRWFVAKKVRYIYDEAPPSDVGRCFQAAYLSYAANNPSWASTHLLRTTLSSSEERYSVAWLTEVLRELTFGPKVVIYPHRYNAIRPVLEKMYGVDLPDFAAELKQWTSDWGPPMPTDEVQGILVRLGHDLGISGPNGDGVDNVYGGKTRRAVRRFQEVHGLEPTGYVDPATRDALQAARDAVEAVKEDDAITPELRRRVQGLVATTLADMARRAVESAREGVA
jgi:hypothetical protein